MAVTKTPPMAILRMVLWGLVVVAGIGATILYLFFPPERPVGLFGGDFTLQSTAGGSFTEQDLKGAPSLIFFGYTYCPDVCPTTLVEATGWREELGLSTDELRLIFATVDPERDTVGSLSSYLSIFSSPVIGLSGTSEQVEQAKKAFGVFSERVDDPAATEYLVNHTASVFLIDGDGRFQSTIAFGEERAPALAKIRKLVGL